MKKIILLCLISVSLILSGCDTSDDKWTEPATDEEMKQIETELTELYDFFEQFQNCNPGG